jgi:hypothetical protein
MKNKMKFVLSMGVILSHTSVNTVKISSLRVSNRVLSQYEMS